MDIPEQIGRYEILRELGRGGMAIIYLAHDPVMARQVALKLLPPQFTVNEDLRERFQREARIIASLEHPAIVPVHDFGEFNNQPYLVMRYMPGGSLRDRLQGRPLSVERTLSIMQPLAPALDLAHDRHIIHRDLKPENILFDGDNNPYLSDFGIARMAVGTQTNTIMGTPAYMSPEQIQGGVPLDSRSDIYSLGVILFEMLAGEQPFKGDTATQVMMKHVLEPVPDILELAPHLPSATREVIERAMAKDRERRFRSTAELLHAVEQLAEAPAARAVAAATMVEPPAEDHAAATRIAGKLPQTEEQTQLGTLYQQMQTAVARSDWVETLALGARIQKIDPHYRDVPTLLSKASAQLTQAQGQPVATAPPPPAPAVRRGQRWPLFLLLALLVLVVGGGVVWAASSLLGGDDEPLPAVVAETPAVQDEATAVAEAVPAEIVEGEAAAEDNTVGEAAAADEEPVPAGAEPSPTPTSTAVPTATATVPPTNTPAAVEEGVLPPPAAPAADAGGQLLFSADFADKSDLAKWDLWSSESAEFSVSDGELFAVGRDASTFNWTTYDETVTAVDLTVDADILQGAASAFFGVMFVVDEDNHIGCLVQGDNTGYCTEKVAGEAVFGDWVRVDLSVLTANQVRLVVADQGWAVTVNGACLGAGVLPVVAEGQIGLLVSTSDNEVPVRVAYDNLEVRTPDAGARGLLSCTPQYLTDTTQG